MGQRRIFFILILVIIGVSFQGLALAAPYAYIPNQANDTVSVIDIATNTVTSTISVGIAPWGVAVSPDGTKAYVGNGNSNTVSVIDTATNSVIATINAGTGPIGVAVSPDGNTVYAVCYGGYYSPEHYAYVIDAATNTVKSTISVGNGPYAVVASPDGARVYVNSADGLISVIDTETNTVVSQINIGVPNGIACNPTGTKVYVVNVGGSSLSVIDAATNTVTAAIGVGINPEWVAVSPDGTRAYVTNWGVNHIYHGTLSVIDTVTNKVIDTIDVGVNPEGVLVDPTGTKLYLVNSNMNLGINGTISVFDTATNNIIATIDVGGRPSALGQFIVPPPSKITSLNITSNLTNVTVGISTNLIFNVTSNGLGVDNATVSLKGNATGSGITNSSGIAIINVNATTTGTITVTASKIGYFKGRTTLVAITPQITPTPSPISSTGGIVLPFSFGNNSGIVQYPSKDKTVSTILALVIGVLLAWFWPWLAKLLQFLYDAIKSYLQKQLSTKEAKYRGVTAKPKKPLLYGVSLVELFVGFACILLIGITFAYAKDYLLNADKLLIIIVAAGITIVVSEMVRRFTAHHYKAETEYKFWDAGAIILVITSLLHQPFSRPARTIINKPDELGVRKQGIIAMAPCVVSLLLSIGFLLLLAYGNSYEMLGREGFKMGMMLCVYSLMPFEPMDGKRVINWNKWAWAIVFLPALAFYLGMLLFVL